MLRLKRTRYPKIDLIARYSCPMCQETKELPVALRPGFGGDIYPRLFWRPTEYYGKCGARMEYEGFVRRKDRVQE